MREEGIVDNEDDVLVLFAILWSLKAVGRDILQIYSNWFPLLASLNWFLMLAYS